MTCVIINERTGARVRVKDRLTPFFDYPIQAEKYIDKMLGGSPYATIREV